MFKMCTKLIPAIQRVEEVERTSHEHVDFSELVVDIRFALALRAPRQRPELLASSGLIPRSWVIHEDGNLLTSKGRSKLEAQLPI